MSRIPEVEKKQKFTRNDVFFTPLCLRFVSSFLAFTRPLLCQGGTQLLLEVIQLLLFLM